MSADTTGLRETLAAHFIMWHDVDGRIGGEWRCACGLKFGFSDTAIDHIAHQVEQASREAPTPEPHSYAIEVLVNPGSMAEYWSLYRDEFEQSDEREEADQERALLLEDGFPPEHVRVVGLVTR